MAEREYRVCYTPEKHGIKIGHYAHSNASIECDERAHHRSEERKQKAAQTSTQPETTATPWQPAPELSSADTTVDALTRNTTAYDTSKELVLILTRGIPSSGKTSWAKQWVEADPSNRTRINRDDLRKLTYDKYVLTDFGHEKVITRTQKGLLKTYLFGNRKDARSVIMDDTFLNTRNMKDIIDYVRSEQIKYAADHDGYWRKIKIIVKDFPLTLEEALERNVERANRGDRSVPANVVEKMFQQGNLNKKGEPQPISEELAQRAAAVSAGTKPEQYQHDRSLKKSGFLVDVDGTLAFIDKTVQGHRSPYDYTRVIEDKPNQPVIDMVKAFKSLGKHIIIMSGREDSCQPETEAWLKQYGVPYDEIHMRRTGDQRADHVIKWELYNTYVKGNMNVEACIDDRNQVVDMYRSRGFKVFQVAPGDF